jgi:hypothetical protein
MLQHSQLRSSITSSNSILNLPVPTIPPPPPPPPPSRLASPPQTTPPSFSPPPPPPSITSLLSLIQTKEETSLNTIKIKIENDRLLQHLVKLGYDRTKSACVLLIANNNLDIATEILSKYTTKL